MGPDQTATAAGARPPAKPDHRVDERLDPQPPPQRDRQHDPGIDDHALVIKDDARSVRQGLHPCR
jgi:hypothetical protein